MNNIDDTEHSPMVPFIKVIRLIFAFELRCPHFILIDIVELRVLKNYRAKGGNVLWQCIFYNIGSRATSISQVSGRMLVDCEI